MEQFIAELEAYAQACGWKPSTLCQKINSNAKLYKRLKSGGSCTLKTVEKYRAYMAANPPPALSPVPDNAA